LNFTHSHNSLFLLAIVFVQPNKPIKRDARTCGAPSDTGSRAPLIGGVGHLEVLPTFRCSFFLRGTEKIMSLWDSICDNVICPIGRAIDDGVCAVGRGIDTVVTTVVIDGVCGGIDNAVDFVKENPGKSAAIAAATVVTGGLASVAAPAIAAGLGSAGVLGAASTGTAISTLSGAALTNASLAAVGGGALAAGGGGMAAGTAVIAGTGAVAGGAVSAGVAKAAS
jgi:hypothetical protein